jgi:lysophospholipase L1-like esterase
MTSQQISLFRTVALWIIAGLAAGSASFAAVGTGSKQNPSEKLPPSPPGETGETQILSRPLFATGSAMQEPKTAPTRSVIPLPTPPGLRYLALGDSYTVGEKVADGDRFPAILTKRLRARGFELRSPQILARTGWTTSDLSASITNERPQGTFDLVTLLIGVNNQYRGLDLESYRREFGALVDQAVVFAGMDPGRVIVISVPDWGAMPYARNFDHMLIRQQIDAFNKANKGIAMEKGVRYVNITELARKASEDPTMAASDGLHPSSKQYQIWVDAILPEALAALGL